MPRVVLIGAPGSGKSSVGKALAKSLRLHFVETDLLVQARTGTSISDIFMDQGEEVFRQFEFEALVLALKEPLSVLSLGGGASIPERAQRELEESGAAIVFLDVSLSVAAPRVGFNRDRPLLLGNPRAQWQALYEARRPIYEKLATVTIKVDTLRISEIVKAIKEAI